MRPRAHQASRNGKRDRNHRHVAKGSSATLLQGSATLETRDGFRAATHTDLLPPQYDKLCSVREGKEAVTDEFATSVCVRMDACAGRLFRPGSRSSGHPG